MNHGHDYREKLPPAAAGRTVHDHLVERWRHGSAGDWSDRLARGEVTLDGVRAEGGEPLAAGHLLTWHRPPWDEPPVPLGFALLHRDDHLLATGKPAGVPTMPSGGRFLEHTLLHQVRARWPEAVPLHRLDRGTSGIVLFARSELARRALGRAWQRGEVRRHYVGLVEGEPRDDSFTIDAPIGELPDPRIGRVFAAVTEGAKGVGSRACRTRVQVMARRGATTLVAIEIESGRPHQIRIHLAFAGHPLVGEPFFGPGGRPRAEGDALPGDPGYLLHAERLALVHPATGKFLEVWCAAASKLRFGGTS